jgi:enterochelin esterase family protein
MQHASLGARVFALALCCGLAACTPSAASPSSGRPAGNAGSGGTSGGAGSGDAGSSPSGAAGTAVSTGAGGSSAGPDAGAAAGVTGAAGTTSGAAGAATAGSTGAAGVTGVVDASVDDSGVVVADPGTVGDGDFMIGPTYVVAPELTPGNVPRGVVTGFNIASTESPIFPGVTGPYTRQGWIYVPKQYVAGTPAPFIIAQDGRDYMARLPAILDSMIAAKRLPIMIAVMVMAGPGDGPGSERGWEYDTISEDFVNWIESTVLPKMTKSYGVKFTTSPEGRATMGGSSGGSAAFTMGWFRPDLYRRILTFSGTYTAQGKTTAYPMGAWSYPDHLVAQTPGKPLRVWLEVAEHDAGATNTEASMHNWIIANQKMAAALMAQGYHTHFDYALGAMHNDPKVWDQTLPTALEWLWRGYPK